jgi:hypothetical protein
MMRVAKLIVLVSVSGGVACGAQLITNGGFESGTLAGWTVASQAGSFAGSGFFALSGTITPQSGSSTVGPASGAFYAVSDGNGPGAHALLQPFVVPGASTVLLSFSLFVNSDGGNFVNPIGLDFTDGANQHARVDILSAGAAALTTGTGVLRNFYLGTDSGPNPHAYASLNFDITSLVGGGGSFQLRFAEVDNQSFLNMGVDNVSIVATPAGVPEPVSFIQAALGLAGVGLLRRTRARAATASRGRGLK